MSDISSEDVDTRARGEALLNTALETAAAIGSRYLCGVLYSTLGKYKKPAIESNLDYSAEVLSRLCARAQKMGIMIGLEPCNRYETNLLNTAAQTKSFIEKMLGGIDNVVVHLDTYHMHIEEKYEEAVAAAGMRAGYLHVGESHRGALGSGNVVSASQSCDKLFFCHLPLTYSDMSIAHSNRNTVDIGLHTHISHTIECQLLRSNCVRVIFERHHELWSYGGTSRMASVVECERCRARSDKC